MVLTGESQIQSPSPAPVETPPQSPASAPVALKEEGVPLETGHAAAQSPDSPAVEAAEAAAAVHPLRVYCEYLSYLFRKPPLPDGQEQLEVGYRDYLQVTHFTICPS